MKNIPHACLILLSSLQSCHRQYQSHHSLTMFKPNRCKSNWEPQGLMYCLQDEQASLQFVQIVSCGFQCLDEAPDRRQCIHTAPECHQFDCNLKPQVSCTIFTTNRYNGEFVNVFVAAKFQSACGYEHICSYMLIPTSQFWHLAALAPSTTTREAVVFKDLMLLRTGLPCLRDEAFRMQNFC